MAGASCHSNDSLQLPPSLCCNTYSVCYLSESAQWCRVAAGVGEERSEAVSYSNSDCLMGSRLCNQLFHASYVSGAFGTEWSVKYNQQEICALKGSTVFMSGTLTHPGGLRVTEVFWVIDPALNLSWPDMSKNPDFSGRVEYLGDEQKLVSLKLRDVMKKDEHEYCVRIKTDQEMQKYLQRPGVRLTVTELCVEAPEEVTEGETADLTCKTTCSLTDPTFIWYKNGRPLTTKTIKNNQLHLQTVSSEDAGSYSCAVGGSQHLRSTAHSLRVRYPPKSVSVSISPSGEIVEGSSVTLTCSSDGNPPVKMYTWFKGSTPVGEGKTYSIPNIRSEDSGEYTCQSRNDLGERRSTDLQINVLYPPKSVSVSISPSGEIVEGSSVTLTCSSDGNPPVKMYTWFKGSTPVGEGKTYSIPNIRSEHSGEYTCQSWNDHGQRRSTAIHLNVLYSASSLTLKPFLFFCSLIYLVICLQAAVPKLLFAMV
uniref:Ig-like domain-containing protein n=1 Tax=Pygocentrus nattereri TaxID=42514 RepID=A0AAR2KJU5_PYGNA